MIAATKAPATRFEPLHVHGWSSAAGTHTCRRCGLAADSCAGPVTLPDVQEPLIRAVLTAWAPLAHGGVAMVGEPIGTGGGCEAISFTPPGTSRWEVLVTDGDLGFPVTRDGTMPAVVVTLTMDGEDAASVELRPHPSVGLVAATVVALSGVALSGHVDLA